MLSQLTIPKQQQPLAFDYQQLYAIGLEYVQKLSGQVWTDFNVHDPGVTILELLCYALTDLSYRASLPIADILATSPDQTEATPQAFFTARQILPNRPLTLLDYRKLLIDIQGIKNAWIRPARRTYYADTIQGKLLKERPRNMKGIREVNLAGLYEVQIEYNQPFNTEDQAIASVKQKLQGNRNLCEDFISFKTVEEQKFQLCAELELLPTADVAKVKAEILIQVQEYLSPPVRFYTLSEMLARRRADGVLYAVDEIFDGPALDHGFIDDDELEKADLRTEIRLSDVISIIMDIEGVQAVRDIIIAPKRPKSDAFKPLNNKWIIPVEPGKRASLSVEGNLPRLVFYKRNQPVVARATSTTILRRSEQTKPEKYDLEMPSGTFRSLDEYYSFQNHFPVIYGLGEAGLSTAADDRRKALAYQLKAYLLFFDQIMANYCSQLNQVRKLFSTNPAIRQTYYHQVVRSFTESEKIYTQDAIDALQGEDLTDEQANGFDRRNRFLDHLIARFAERAHDLAYTIYSDYSSGSGADAENCITQKCRFLADYPTISADRGLAYNYSLANDVWDTDNVSGLEKRLAKLLDIRNVQRRDLIISSESVELVEDGMYLIENMLLRPEQQEFLPICPDPNCTDCSELDPYSYRIHIILPVGSPRWGGDITLRRFVEQVIREETPAHILPKICWASNDDIKNLQEEYHKWIDLKAGSEEQSDALKKLIEVLYGVKNIYPSQQLHDCDSPEEENKFILGQTALGSNRTS